MVITSIIAGLMLLLLSVTLLLMRRYGTRLKQVPYLFIGGGPVNVPAYGDRKTFNADALLSRSIILLGFLGGGYIILSGNPDPNAQKVATGVIGTALGWATARLSSPKKEDKQPSISIREE